MRHVPLSTAHPGRFFLTFFPCHPLDLGLSLTINRIKLKLKVIIIYYLIP
ncbi:Hypothetical protein ETEE_0944 [Edwardsiella anguillarum ET080813]|uniref:Uncharacterized protein n=1 Tax=Edwardsiella anguillarum ET080813 TaxID=667120 RepID=A0A076LH60_9GAMM|nr:Hypothetical protein ETEE_0944 [Edwardsiella anguillarum ET080813]